jgi:hypothetical protein
MFQALLLLRQLAAKGDLLEQHFILGQRTRWLQKRELTFELEVKVEGSAYIYRLVLEPWGDPEKPRIRSETVHLDGRPIFEFLEGEVHLYDDKFEHKATYGFDSHRSALATIVPRNDNRNLIRYKSWLSSMFMFQLNPFSMGSRAEGESAYPNVDLSNFASWYRHLLQGDQKVNATLLNNLRECLDGFTYLHLESVGENIRLLLAEFDSPGGKPIKYSFNELSEGQRCLICLYTVLHFVLAKGGTVLFDEPDNFLSLREIQPWLIAVDDLLEDGHGQALVVTHHPEIINQWAPESGIQLVREESGPVRIERFHGDPESFLPPAELIARGWERE